MSIAESNYSKASQGKLIMCRVATAGIVNNALSCGALGSAQKKTNYSIVILRTPIYSVPFHGHRTGAERQFTV